jgi:hypothetical protein
VYQCADQPATDPGSCTEELDEVPSNAGRWSAVYTPSVGEIQNSCVGQCYIEATDGTTDLVSTLTFATPSVAIKPVTDNGYFIDERVMIDVRSFPRDNPVTIEICSGSIDNCDPDTAETKTANGAGNATFRGYGMDPSICSSTSNECFMVAEDFTYANGPTEAVEQFVPYCGPIVCPGLAQRRP